MRNRERYPSPLQCKDSEEAISKTNLNSRSGKDERDNVRACDRASQHGYDVTKLRPRSDRKVADLDRSREDLVGSQVKKSNLPGEVSLIG